MDFCACLFMHKLFFVFFTVGLSHKIVLTAKFSRSTAYYTGRMMILVLLSPSSLQIPTKLISYPKVRLVDGTVISHKGWLVLTM